MTRAGGASRHVAARVPRSSLRGVYALVDPARDAGLARLDALLGAGIRLVQVRAKAGLARDLFDAVVARVRAAGGLAIVNDDVALALHADGVHLGQEDAALHDLAALRDRLGGRVLGLSCGTPVEARAVDPALIDYAGVGPVFATPSKPDAGLPIGISGCRAVVLACPVPCAAIGGITVANAHRARETGAAMCAAIGTLAGEAPAAAARALIGAWCD